MQPTQYVVDTIVYPLKNGERQKGYRQSVEGPFPFEDEFSRGIAFKIFRKQYGICKSKVYVDQKSGGPSKEVGWVFEKKQKYDDSAGFYIQETWVTLSQKCDCCGGSGQII